jgi:hypothetical protein
MSIFLVGINDGLLSDHCEKAIYVMYLVNSIS